MKATPTVWLLTPSAVEADVIRATLPQGHEVFWTGVGALATLHTLWQRFVREKPQALHLVVVGIAGSYIPTLAIPSVVYVREEIWGDLGRRYGRRFVPASEKLRGGFPLRWKAPASPLPLPQVVGLTLHTVSATRREARYWKRTYPEAEIETQEGAAYFAFGEAVGAPVYAFRVLSNYVGHRHWEKDAALALLATFTAKDVVPLCERLMDRDSRTNAG